MEITSHQNTHIKFIKKLYRKRYRDQYQLYIAEGLRLVEDIAKTGMIQELYYTDKLLTTTRGEQLLSALQAEGIAAYKCAQSVFSEICSTDSDQGVLAVVRQPQPVTDWRDHLHKGVVLVIDQLQDPGNLGTIMRTALGAGIDGVWLIDGTVDPFNPKVVRASMGAVQSLPIAYMTAQECYEQCQKLGLTLVGADVRGALPYYQCDFTTPCALVIGNEANGIQPALLEKCQQRVCIPIVNGVESLNAAIAAAVLIYEVVRQHRLI